MKNTHPHFSQESLIDLIGLPYRSFDCWDVIKLFHRKVMKLDIEINIYDRHTIGKKGVSRLIEIEKRHFRQVSVPEVGDVIVFRIMGIASHVGVYVGDGSFLHTMEKTGCVIDKLAKWEKRIEGIFRHGKI